jgi:hypothetical protein
MVTAHVFQYYKNYYTICQVKLIWQVPERNELHVIINMRVKTDCLNLSILHNLEYTRLYAKEMYETISFQILRISSFSKLSKPIDKQIDKPIADHNE